MTLQDTNTILTDYQIISKIGEGGFSKVYRVKDNKTGNYYAAKISNFMIDEDTKDSQEAILLFREINLMSLLNHPSILKFIGYYPNNFEDDPVPTIITEIALNGSLREIIKMEISGLSPDDWDSTKKLINIYGIASGMSYLHSHNILHRDLKPENILIDDYLYPKISDFGLSKITDFLSVSMNIQSQKGLKGTPIYMAPEIMSNEKYSKSGDVYAFAFIVFEILTCEEPFENMNYLKLMKKVAIEGYRPEIKEYIPEAYRELIEKCWSQDPDERPSFDQIVDELKNNKDFITELVDQSEFYDYIDFIDNYRTTFDVSKRAVRFADFIKSQGRNKMIKTVSLYKTDLELDNSQDKNENTKFNPQTNETQDDSSQTKSHISKKLDENTKTYSQKMKIIEEQNENTTSDSQKMKIIEEQNENTTSNSQKMKINETEDENQENIDDLIYPLNQFDQLSKKNQKLVKQSRNDQEKQYEVGQLLIEGRNDFPENISLGLQYLKNSADKGCINAVYHYAKYLLKGKIILKDLEKAENYIYMLKSTQDARIHLLQGLLNRKKNMYSEAVNFFKQGAKAEDCECMYKYGEMLFLGEGIKKNNNEAFQYFKNSKEKGFLKSEYFLTSFQSLNSLNEFSGLSAETQLLLIKSCIKNLIDHNGNVERIFDKIVIQSHKTEKLFFNKSLKLQTFHKCLSKYNYIYITIEYPSSSFKPVIDLVTKIQKNINKIKIGIAFSSFEKYDDDFDDIDGYIQKSSLPKKCFSNYISFHAIAPTICTIPEYAFMKCFSLTQINIPSSVTSIGDFAFCKCTSLTQINIPSSATSIGDFAFCKCTSLTQINIPSSVISIGDCAFQECTSLTQIRIPFSVISIGDYAFQECTSLTQINIPSSVTSFGSSVFNKIPEKTKIIIPSSITKMKDINLEQASNMSEITIPLSISSIGSYAFFRFKMLKKVSIPASIKSIESNAFNECSSLIEVVIPASVTSIGNCAFYKCSSLAQISIPSSITTIEESTFFLCSSLTQVSIPSSVISIGRNAFCECSSLKQILIPSSVISIESSSFDHCTSLSQVTFESPSSLTTIGLCSFGCCESLKQITIPSSVVKIDTAAFKYCTSLTKVKFEIPSSISEIDYDYIFTHCTSLKEIIIPSHLKKKIKVGLRVKVKKV